MSRLVCRARPYVAALLLATVSSSPAAAAVGSWTDVALPGFPGAVLALAVSPATEAVMYAGTEAGGVLMSIDGGATWTPRNTGLGAHLTVQALAIHPTSPQTMYAGTLTGGVFTSADGGANWSSASNGLLTTDVSVLTFRPGDPSTIYAGTDSGIFVTTDAAGAWAPANKGLTEPDVRAIAASPTTPGLLFAGTAPLAPTDRGLFRSTDGGGTWAAAGAGPTSPRSVAALAIRPGTPDAVYAGFERPSRSLDSGATWEYLNRSPGSVTQIAFDGDPSAFYAATLGAGVARVNDVTGAVGWPARTVPTGLGDLNVTTLAALSGPTLVAGTRAGTVARLTVPETDLAVTARRTGTLTEYTVTNRGPALAPAVHLQASGTLTPSQGSCFGGQCELGTLAPGAAATVQALAARPGEPRSATTAAYIRDTNPANDSFTDSPGVGTPLPPPPSPPPVVAAPRPPVATPPPGPRATQVRVTCAKRPATTVRVRGRAVRVAPPCRVRVAFRMTRSGTVTITFTAVAGARRALTLGRLAETGVTTVVVPDRLRPRLRPGRYSVTVRPAGADTAAGAGVFTTLR